VRLEVDDRIAYELARSVKGHVSPSLYFMELDPACGESSGWSDQVPILGRPTECHHRRMLEENEQIVRQLSAYPCTCGGALQLQRIQIRDDAHSRDPQWCWARIDHP
jgi:hypothetical protein